VPGRAVTFPGAAVLHAFSDSGAPGSGIFEDVFSGIRATGWSPAPALCSSGQRYSLARRLNVRRTERPGQEHRKCASGEPSCPEVTTAGNRRRQGPTNPVLLVSAGSRGTTRHEGGAGIDRAVKIGTVTSSGKFILLMINIVVLNLKNSKLYNTRRSTPAWRAVAGSSISQGHLTGLPGFIAAVCRIALPVAGRR